MPCIACGECACSPEMTDVGVGLVQVEACECPGCWDRRKVQLDEECKHWDDLAAGRRQSQPEGMER